MSVCLSDNLKWIVAIETVKHITSQVSDLTECCQDLIELGQKFQNLKLEQSFISQLVQKINFTYAVYWIPAANEMRSTRVMFKETTNGICQLLYQKKTTIIEDQIANHKFSCSKWAIKMFFV